MNKTHVIWEKELLKILDSYDIRSVYIRSERPYEFDRLITKSEIDDYNSNILVSWSTHQRTYTEENGCSINEVNFSNYDKFEYAKNHLAIRKTLPFSSGKIDIILNTKKITTSNLSNIEKYINLFFIKSGVVEKIRNKKIDLILS